MSGWIGPLCGMHREEYPACVSARSVAGRSRTRARISDRGTRRCEMTAATLDLSVLADGQLDNDRAPLRQLADAVAALWSAGTGLALQPAAVALEDAHARVVLAEPCSRGEEAPEQAALCRLDRP